MLEAQGRLAGAGRGAYLFDFMHSFAIEFLHWKQERVELRERRERPWATLVAVSHRTAHLGLPRVWVLDGGGELGGCDVGHPRGGAVCGSGGRGCGASGCSMGSILPKHG